MTSGRGGRAVAPLVVGCLAACAWTVAAQAQPVPDPLRPAGMTAPAAGAPGETSFLVENVTRGELWRYFAPPPDGGTDPDYVFIGSRSTIGAAYRGPRWAVNGALQYVRLENLPSGAIGPGLLGNGGAYYFQAAGTFSYQFYLRALSLEFHAPSQGLWLEAGRLSRAASTETSSGDASIDRLVRDELNGRLLGDAEWSFYQRAWDGVRGGVRRPGGSLTVTAAVPTQGTFEESANLAMDRVRVGAAEVTLQPGTVARRTRLSAFGIAYDDTRAVTSRPDNMSAEAVGVDIRIWTVGASAVGAYPWRGGTSDVSAWGAVQSGRWYELSHRAVAATLAAGHRFTALAARPWVRVGVSYASGDGSVADGRHGTFFPMLPSGDRVSSLNAYALMNVVDRWAALEVTPHAALDVRGGVRRVGLASAVDRWYQGSGATLRRGNYFGFQGRDARGGTAIGTVLEGSATWRARRWWTLGAYAGRMAGGDVVTRTFRGRRLVSAWLESTLRF